MPRDDATRLSALYDAHAAPVWRYVVHLTGDRAGADDVVQETLLRAWRTPRILEQDPATTRSWMFTVARHLVIDDARSAHAGARSRSPRPRMSRRPTSPMRCSRRSSSRRRSPSLSDRPPHRDRARVLRRAADRRDRRRARHPAGHREVATALRTSRAATRPAGEGGDAMNDPDHAQFAEWDAAYVLGALSPADRRRFEAHLQECDACRDAIVELAPTIGAAVAGRARARRVAARSGCGDDGPGCRAPRRSHRPRRRRQSQRRRRLWWAGGLAAAAAIDRRRGARGDPLDRPRRARRAGRRARAASPTFRSRRRSSSSMWRGARASR